MSTLVINRELAAEFSEALAQGVVLGDWTPDNACDVAYRPDADEDVTHHFSTLDGIHCKHCGGYPFDLRHWSLG